MQSRRRAALAASLFPNIERQREKSLLLPAHQSHHHRGRWPSPPKNNHGATGHACFLGTKGDNTPRGSRDGAERGGGKNLGLFPPSPLSTNKAACVVPAVRVNSDQGRLSLFVFTSGIQPVQLRIAANCLFPAGSASVPVVLTCVKESVMSIMERVTLAQSCSCLKPRSPPPPPPPPLPPPPLPPQGARSAGLGLPIGPAAVIPTGPLRRDCDTRSFPHSRVHSWYRQQV